MYRSCIGVEDFVAEKGAMGQWSLVNIYFALGIYMHPFTYHPEEVISGLQLVR